MLGLVRWKRDTWWIGERDAGRRVNRGTVLLGLTLLVLPTGFGRWSWTAFRPVPERPPVSTSSSAPVVVSTVPSAPTPATCGKAMVNAQRGLRLRDGVGTDTLILGTLPHLTPVELLCSWQDPASIHWAYVRAQGQVGWIAEQEGPHRYLTQPER